MTIRIGVVAGQRAEPSALCVVEPEERTGPHGSETHYFVRHLERLRIGTPSPTLGDRAARVAAGVSERTTASPYLYLDATGRGEPVVKLFAARVRQARVVGVYFTHGDRRDRIRPKEIRLGKLHLVTTLQTLLETDCLHLPRTPDTEALAADLRDFQVQMAEDANDPKFAQAPIRRHQRAR